MQADKRRWSDWIEPWYLVYAIMGLVVAGLVPVLIPLAVGRSGSAGQVGLVVAAVSLGGLTSPLWGSLADRYRVHRGLLAGGMLVACLGLAAFPFTSQTALWVLLAMLAGLGSASAATVANLFVVEAHPKAEWDDRIGWLQTFYGVGQVAGLLLAGVLTRIDLHIGLLAAAGLSAAAAILGWLTTKTPPAQPGPKAVLLHPAKHAESAISSPQRLFHAPKWPGRENLGRTLRSPYGIFLIVWLLAFAGPAAVFSQYPLFMQKVFGVTPDSSSVAFAIIAGLGLALYTPAGNWSNHYGPQRILRLSLGLRLLAFAAMLGLVFLPGSGTVGWLALLAFAFVVWAWSLMSVSGTDLAARLSPAGEGQGLGIFNAMTAVASILGALLGGWAAGAWGYGSIAGLALGGVALGLGLSFAASRGIASSGLDTAKSTPTRPSSQ
jgi:DHA1 family tetracycline resistance protein-like MFS transporter